MWEFWPELLVFLVVYGLGYASEKQRIGHKEGK